MTQRLAGFPLALVAGLASVSCHAEPIDPDPAAAGPTALEIAIRTYGRDLDTNGYVLRLDRDEYRVAPTQVLLLEDVLPGRHMLDLEDLAVNCVIERDVPITLNVPPGPRSRMQLSPVCEELLTPPLEDPLVFQCLSGTMGTNPDVCAWFPGSRLPRRLTRSRGFDGEPDVSPSGEFIALTTDRTGDLEIFISRLDGSGIANVSRDPTAADYAPAWSPDGTRLAWVQDGPRGVDIVLGRVDGTGVVNLTRSASTREGPMSWAPDGSRIVFGAAEEGATMDVYVIDVNGSNLTRLTREAGVNDYPVWSPDGSQIAFVSDRDGDLDIMIMDPDGANQVNLTTTRLSGSEDTPAWTPDGHILFSERQSWPQFRIFLMNADGSSQRPIFQMPTDALHPTMRR